MTVSGTTYGAYALTSYLGGLLTASGGSVTTLGGSAVGARASGAGSRTVLSDLTISTAGSSAYGIQAQASSSLQATRANVTTAGTTRLWDMGGFDRNDLGVRQHRAHAGRRRLRPCGQRRGDVADDRRHDYHTRNERRRNLLDGGQFPRHRRQRDDCHEQHQRPPARGRPPPVSSPSISIPTPGQRPGQPAPLPRWATRAPVCGRKERVPSCARSTRR